MNNEKIVRQNALPPLTADQRTPIMTPIVEVDWDQVMRLRPAMMKRTQLPPYLLLPEASRIINAAHDTPSRIFYILLWVTGARLSEIHFLMKENFHLDHSDLPYINLPTLKQQRGYSILKELQREKKRSAIRAKIRKLPHRMIGITDAGYLGELNRYLTDLRGHSSEFLFQPETARTLQNWLTRDAAHLDIDIDVTPKAFRHGFGVSATLQGVETAALQELMGHTRIENTAIYTKVFHGHYAFMTKRMRFS